jgi:hypothetical protein
MPESYNPKGRSYPLSNLIDGMRLVRIRCRYCKREHCYRPDDLIQIFRDVDVDSLMGHAVRKPPVPSCHHSSGRN